MIVQAALFAAATLVCVLLTWLVRRHALSRGMLDVPNARSSHTQPTPRGGGAAIAAVILATAVLCGLLGHLPVRDAIALVAGGSMIALVGYYDDRRGLSARARIAVHALAAAVAVAGLIDFEVEARLFPALPSAVAFILFLVGIVWSTNLFNFMDGIDGIAGSQAAFVSLASAVLVAVSHSGATEWLILPTVTAGACAGFLVWNWPPARIFMGDVGSGFLGFWLACMALAFASTGALSIWTSTILGSLFIADATVTLVRRALRGERWYEAHRSHAYQSLARRWGSHRRVTGVLWVLNIFVVSPLAAVSVFAPSLGAEIATATLAGFGLLVLLAGAGNGEAQAMNARAR